MRETGAYRRSGTLWEGRYRSCPAQEEDDLLACQQYRIESSTCEMAEHPADSRWSSYRGNAQGETDALITAHELYRAPGLVESERQAAYRELFRHEPNRVWWMRFGKQRTAISLWVGSAMPNRWRRPWGSG